MVYRKIIKRRKEIMSVIGLFLLLFVVVCVTMVLYLIAGNGVTPPVDSYGQTTTEATNLTAGNVTGLVKTGMAVNPWLAMLVVVLIIAAVFLWALSQRSNHHNFLSRYS
jgi:hypothetical protein